MSEHNNKATFIFEGFDNPNTTQVPDVFFDVVAPELTEAELRVSLYIIRRTFGFKKEKDDISLRQMVDGITTRDGRVLDRGTGLRKSAVANALNGLERKGVIVSRRNHSAERGNEPTTYALNTKNNPLSVPVDKGLSVPVDKPLSVPVDTQHTVVQQTDRTFERPRSRSIIRKGRDQHNAAPEEPGGSAATGRVGATEQTGKRRTGADQVDEGARSELKPQNLGSRGMSHVGQTLARSYSSYVEPVARSYRGYAQATTEPPLEDAPRPLKRRESLKTPQPLDIREAAVSDAPEGATGGTRRGTRATQQIAALIELWSRELHDPDHIPSNVAQAANLWRESGLGEQEFVGLMYQARKTTRARGNIKRKAEGELGQYGVTNRMPYFYAVLRDLLGLKEETDRPPPGQRS